MDPSTGIPRRQFRRDAASLAATSGLIAAGYRGVFSMECEGQSGPMIEKSLAWLCQTFGELNITVEA
jgi:hypothetical protein